MEIEKTHIEGCVVLKPKLFSDERGWFTETYNEKAFFEATGNDVRFVQDNQSFSHKGVIRGLHFQTGAAAQAKLVSVVMGEVLDVAVDLRSDSPTYGQHVALRLSAENRLQLFVPRGFAHGFQVLSETTLFSYKCDNFYNKDAERGLRYDDPHLAIPWLELNVPSCVSKKDLELSFFK